MKRNKHFVNFKTFFFSLVFCFTTTLGIAQSLYFPPISGTQWETVSPDSLGWCPDKIDTLLTYLENRDTKGFIVLKDGKIAIEKYYGTFNQDSSWYWASAGKSLVAFLTGLAQQNQHLAITDTTAKYLGTGWTSCTPVQEEKIKIVHQLSMATGLDDSQNTDCTLPSCLTYLAAPNTRWAYHNAPYTLLQDVISQATGTGINAFVAQELTTKTGISGLFIPINDISVFVSKPRNMARFGLLMLNRGTWQNTPVLTDTAYFDAMISPSQSLNNSYGYLWWLNGQSSYMVPQTQIVFPGPMLPSAPSDMYAALGKNGQLINVVPSENLVVVRIGNSPNNALIMAGFNDTIWQKLNDVFCSSIAIEELTQPKFYQLYPNPSTGYFICESLKISTLAIYSMTGGLILKKELEPGNNSVSTNTLSAGLYTVHITVENELIGIEKLIIP